MKKNDNPLVYIVLPVYNWEKYFLEQLMSLYYQNYTNWYLIIVNDWSTDNSENIARDFISHYNIHDKVKVINKENWWLYSAITIWLEEIKKMWDINNSDSLVSYCDCDDIWARSKLQIQVNYMVNHPKCWLSYHDLATIDENWALVKTSQLKWYWHNESFVYIATVWWFFTATEMMFKVKYINDILPMPLWFHMNQDYWTALVLSLLDVKISYIDETPVYHRSYFSLSKKQKKNFFEWRLYYYKFLQERFPEKDLSYIIWCNEDWMINWRKNWKPLIYVWIMLLIKYPKIFFLYLRMKLYKLYIYLNI